MSINLSRLQRVHKPLQVTTSTQTSSGYSSTKTSSGYSSTKASPSYTNPNLPLWSRPHNIKRNTLKRENNESSQRVYFTMVKNCTIFSLKTLDALNSGFTIDTQIFTKFFNVLYMYFSFCLLYIFNLKLFFYMYLCWN